MIIQTHSRASTFILNKPNQFQYCNPYYYYYYYNISFWCVWFNDQDAVKQDVLIWAGLCVWLNHVLDKGPDPFTALQASTSVLKRILAATGSPWRERRSGVLGENLGRLKSSAVFWMSCRGQTALCETPSVTIRLFPVWKVFTVISVVTSCLCVFRKNPRAPAGPYPGFAKYRGPNMLGGFGGVLTGLFKSCGGSQMDNIVTNELRTKMQHTGNQG